GFSPVQGAPVSMTLATISTSLKLDDRHGIVLIPLIKLCLKELSELFDNLRIFSRSIVRELGVNVLILIGLTITFFRYRVIVATIPSPSAQAPMRCCFISSTDSQASNPLIMGSCFAGLNRSLTEGLRKNSAIRANLSFMHPSERVLASSA